MPLGQQLREARRNKQLTQDQLAALLKTSRQRIIAWEKGFSIPSDHYAAQLSTALGIPLQAFAAARPRFLRSGHLEELEAVLHRHDQMFAALQDQLDLLAAELQQLRQELARTPRDETSGA